MPNVTVPYARDSIVFLPGLGRTVMNSASVVAESIAATLDRLTPEEVAVTSEAPSAPPGLQSICTIRAAGTGRRLIDVYQVDYRNALETIDSATDSQEATVPSSFIAGGTPFEPFVRWHSR